MFPTPLRTLWTHETIDTSPRLLTLQEYSQYWGDLSSGRTHSESIEAALRYFQFMRIGTAQTIEMEEHLQYICSNVGHYLLGTVIGITPVRRLEQLPPEFGPLREGRWIRVCLGLNGLYYYSIYNPEAPIAVPDNRVSLLYHTNYQMARAWLFRREAVRYPHYESALGPLTYLVNHNLREFVNPTKIGLGPNLANQVGVRGSIGDVLTFLTSSLDTFHFDSSLVTSEAWGLLQVLCGRWELDGVYFEQRGVTDPSDTRHGQSLWSLLQRGDYVPWRDPLDSAPPDRFLDISSLVAIGLSHLIGIEVRVMSAISDRIVIGNGLLWRPDSWVSTLPASQSARMTVTSVHPVVPARITKRAAPTLISIHSRRRGRDIDHKAPVRKKRK